MTTILYDATQVKTNRDARRFGQGLLRSIPTYRAPYTQADLDWLAADTARREQEAHHLDRLADEAAALDRLERGLCC